MMVKSLSMVRFLVTSPGPATTSCFSCRLEVVLCWPGLAVVVVVVVRLELEVVVVAVELFREEPPASGAILDTALRVTFEVVFD